MFVLSLSVFIFVIVCSSYPEKDVTHATKAKVPKFVFLEVIYISTIASSLNFR